MSARHGEGFFDYAKHWRYRLGVTQILTPSWLMSAEPRGGVRRRLSGQPLPRWRWCSAPLCRSATRARARAARSSCARVGESWAAHLGARRLPLLLGHLGHQGPHLRGRLQPLRRRVLAGRCLPALLHADRRAVLQRQRHHARPSTSRATASSARSTTSRRVRSVTYMYKQVPGRYEIKGNLDYEYQCASSSATSPTCAPASCIRTTPMCCSCW